VGKGDTPSWNEISNNLPPPIPLWEKTNTIIWYDWLDMSKGNTTYNKSIWLDWLDVGK
jgi:hypothetical protein